VVVVWSGWKTSKRAVELDWYEISVDAAPGTDVSGDVIETPIGFAASTSSA
jgi:hypothetical protein